MILQRFIARSRRDRGVTPPKIFRLALIIAYLDLVRRGAKAFRLYYRRLYSNKKFLQNDRRDEPCPSEEGTTQSQALTNIILYRDIKALLSVYIVDLLFAICLKWIAHHRVSIFHMYEHHIPTIIIMGGLVMDMSSSQGPDSKKEINKYHKMCRFTIWTGLFNNVCEVFSIFRTFLQNPDGKTCKVVQAMLGMSMMSISSGIGTITCGKALLERYREWNARISIVDVVLFAGVYQCLLNQSSYALRHYRKMLKALHMDR